MAKHTRTELLRADQGFQYESLEAKLAESVQESDRIRERMKSSIQNIIEIGVDLLQVKKSLPHGQFGDWLRAEFGLSDRSAQNFMSVAEKFKSANIADLPIQPSAVYLLAAPSVPDEARQIAIDRAEAGEEINIAAARTIVAESKKERRPKPRKIPGNKIAVRLTRILERHLKTWGPKNALDFVRHLREYADNLEREHRRSKAKSRT
jgi:Protein of unknown function (DUF3102)